jgi:hypothetical protein
MVDLLGIVRNGPTPRCHSIQWGWLAHPWFATHRPSQMYDQNKTFIYLEHLGSGLVKFLYDAPSGRWGGLNDWLPSHPHN